MKRDEIKKLYEENNKKGWDGYGGLPIRRKNMENALVFFDFISNRSKILIDNLDIVPENTGSLSFDWFRDHDCQVSVSIWKDRFHYFYVFPEKYGRDCGTLPWRDKEIMFSIIKKIIPYIKRSRINENEKENEKA